MKRKNLCRNTVYLDGWPSLYSHNIGYYVVSANLNKWVSLKYDIDKVITIGNTDTLLIINPYQLIIFTVNKYIDKIPTT